MKIPYLIAITAGVAAAAYIVLNLPGPEYATGNDSIEDAARNASEWGSGRRILSVRDKVRGKVKETAGKITGDSDLASDGLVDQAAGAVKDAAGSVAQVAGDAIHELNR
jgi:uncharacterized protein YjbJ (UPF0337 family)